jgi:RHS repeat-associated protein
VNTPSLISSIAPWKTCGNSRPPAGGRPPSEGGQQAAPRRCFASPGTRSTAQQRRQQSWHRGDPSAAETQLHTWDGWQQTTQHRIEQQQPSGQWVAVPTKQFVWGSHLDELVAYRRLSGGAWQNYYLLHGGQETAAKLVDAAGNVVETYEYDPYGRVSVYVGSSTTAVSASAYGLPFLWKSVRLDEITGLLQMRNRYYSVELGRFLTRDPLGVWGDGMNLGNEVGYCNCDPLAGADPMGLQTSPKPPQVGSERRGGRYQGPGDQVPPDPPPPSVVFIGGGDASGGGQYRGPGDLAPEQQRPPTSRQIVTAEGLPVKVFLHQVCVPPSPNNDGDYGKRGWSIWTPRGATIHVSCYGGLQDTLATLYHELWHVLEHDTAKRLIKQGVPNSDARRQAMALHADASVPGNPGEAKAELFGRIMASMVLWGVAQ